jgi:hypothetical protein
MTTKQEIKAYLKRAEELDIDPNFYLSESYLSLTKAKCWSRFGWIWIEEGGWCLFPPLPMTTLAFMSPPNDLKRIWSDFEGKYPDHYHSKYLDLEYIFNPTHFNDMSGGNWETYRKNVRKWPKANANWEYKAASEEQEVQILLGEWIEAKQDYIQDPELIIDYVFQYSLQNGIYRKFLYSDKKLVAINVWDENYKYINYRYCIVKQEEPYLDEFARYLFYTDPEIQDKGKLINDGGSIGNEGLERFKDKLNPVRKREVHSWFI